MSAVEVLKLISWLVLGGFVIWLLIVVSSRINERRPRREGGTLMRKLIRASGEELALKGKISIKKISELIGAEWLDVVLLADRVHVMLVDDLGQCKGLPVNEKATALYHAHCRPGTTWEIRGDVVIVPDQDFEEAGK